MDHDPQESPRNRDRTRRPRRYRDTDDGPPFDGVRIITETERGFVDIETGELVNDAEVVADFTDART